MNIFLYLLYINWLIYRVTRKTYFLPSVRFRGFSRKLRIFVRSALYLILLMPFSRNRSARSCISTSFRELVNVRSSGAGRKKITRRSLQMDIFSGGCAAPVEDVPVLRVPARETGRNKHPPPRTVFPASSVKCSFHSRVCALLLRGRTGGRIVCPGFKVRPRVRPRRRSQILFAWTSAWIDIRVGALARKQIPG